LSREERQSGGVVFRDFLPADVVALALQPSQHVCLGVTRAVHSIEDGEELAEGGEAWTAAAPDGRILCCAGFKHLWPGRHAIAWAMLGVGLGPAHLAVTRFARDRIAESPLSRIEAIVRASVAAECKWAKAVGLRLRADLPQWGPDGETHLLFDRIRSA
jgi:hypothetical protein